MKLIIIITLMIPALVSGVSLQEDLTLTAQEKRALDRFKARVIKKLPDSYMKHDIYLIRFLRAKSFDVNQAENLILENVRWRKANKINTIHLEDFEDIESEGYKAYIESIDREGRPIITANFGDWDLRKAVATGKMQRLERYVDRNFEIARRKIVEFQTAGKNVSQWQFFINMNSWNVLQQGCVPCIPFYIYLTNSAENHFPNHADKIMLINTPPGFEAVLNIIRPLMSPITRRTLKVYNQNMEQWKPRLLQYVSPSELPPEYGGTKIYSDSLKM